MKPKQERSERPGPNIGSPKVQHQVIAMLYFLYTSQSKEDEEIFLEYLEPAVGIRWGWTPERLKAELKQAERVLVEYQGRTTFWFTKEGMEFDYNCIPPKE